MTLYFTEDHEWILVDGDVAIIGITEHAQSQLGDVVFFEPPKAGQFLKKGESAAVVESVKAASEIYAPLTGEIIEINAEVSADPSIVNREAQGSAWMFKMRFSDHAELTGMRDTATYSSFIS